MAENTRGCRVRNQSITLKLAYILDVPFDFKFNDAELATNGSSLWLVICELRILVYFFTDETPVNLPQRRHFVSIIKVLAYLLPQGSSLNPTCRGMDFLLMNHAPLNCVSLDDLLDSKLFAILLNNVKATFNFCTPLTSFYLSV